MTPEQLNALRIDVLANQDTLALYNAGDRAGLAAAYNAPASPEYWVWLPSITKDAIYANGFNWVAIDDVTDPKWRVWVELFDNAERVIHPYKANVRAGIAEVWKGSAAKLAVQTYVLDKCKRTALRVEQVFAEGLGTQANPSVLSYEGTVSPETFIDV